MIETCDDNNTDDEEMDMIADLMDAYKLELQSTGTQSNELDDHKNKNQFELYIKQNKTWIINHEIEEPV